MSKDEEDTEVNEKPEPQAPIFNIRRFVYIFLGMLGLMVMFDTNLRESLGTMIGVPLYGVVGFDGQYPIITLALTGTIMIVFSTLVREILMDWVEMAEIQKKTSVFNKELMNARMANQATKVKKLEKMKPEVQQLSMKTMKPQIKSMAITMVVVISIFASLWTFISALPNKGYSVPWTLNAHLLRNIGPLPFPQWIGIYMLVSIPTGQAFRLLLQMISFRKKLSEEED